MDSWTGGQAGDPAQKQSAGMESGEEAKYEYTTDINID